MALLKLRIFLASSSELAEDRKEFELFISRENKALVKNNVYLELFVWEDFIDSMSRTRLQDEYNNAILRSDIFILLIHTKIGKYTIEEFELAFGQYKETGKPLIYLYFKDAPIGINDLRTEEITSLFSFRQKIKQLGYYSINYQNTESLKQMFSMQLNKFIDSSWEKFEDESEIKQSGLKSKVFISYSHKDNAYLDRLLIHLRPLSNNGIIELWVDTKLSAGERWKDKIEEALKAASVAILLISADFLASDFIINNELPPLLDAAEKNGTQLIPVVLKPCRFARDKKLSLFQAINSPDKPLMGESEFEQEKIYDKVAEWVEINVSKSE